MIHIDEIEARLRANSPNGKPRIVIIGDEPSRREARYIFAGIFAAIFAVMFLIGAVS